MVAGGRSNKDDRKQNKLAPLPSYSQGIDSAESMAGVLSKSLKICALNNTGSHLVVGLCAAHVLEDDDGDPEVDE